MQRICKEWNSFPGTTYFLVTTVKANLINKTHLLGLAASTLALLKDPHLPTHSCYFPRRKFPFIHYLHTSGQTWPTTHHMELLCFWILVQFLYYISFHAHLVKMLLILPDLMSPSNTPVHLCFHSFLCCLISLLKLWELQKYAKEALGKYNFKQLSRVRSFTKKAF